MSMLRDTSDPVAQALFNRHHILFIIFQAMLVLSSLVWHGC